MSCFLSGAVFAGTKSHLRRKADFYDSSFKRWFPVVDLEKAGLLRPPAPFGFRWMLIFSVTVARIFFLPSRWVLYFHPACPSPKNTNYLFPKC